jgi:hypothetical protein
MTALVLAGPLMAIAFLLAVVSIWLWVALNRPGTDGRSRNDHPAEAAADLWAGTEDDTDLDYYDTPSGNIWRLDTQPGRAAAKV